MNKSIGAAPAVPKLLKEINRMQVLNYLRNGTPKSRAELAAALGLSKPTISNIIGELIEHGFVVEDATPKVTGNLGRRPLHLRMNPDIGNIIAVKLGVFFVKAAVFDINFKMKARCMKPIPQYKERESAVSHFIETIDSVVDCVVKDCGTAKFLGMGVGIDASINHINGIMRGNTYHHQWDGIAVKEVLQKKYDTRVIVDNGVNVAALGEYYSLRGKVQNLVAVNVTHTVTAGLVVAGELYRSQNNNVGEFGHMKVSTSGDLCACGSTGCLSALASEVAVIKKAKQLMETKNDTLIQEPTVPAVLEAAAKNDAYAVGILCEVGRYLGNAIAGLANFLNPDVIVLDGRIIRDTDTVYSEILKAYKETTLTGFSSTIMPTTLKGDASLVGASMLVLDNILSGID